MKYFSWIFFLILTSLIGCQPDGQEEGTAYVPPLTPLVVYEMDEDENLRVFTNNVSAYETAVGKKYPVIGQDTIFFDFGKKFKEELGFFPIPRDTGTNGYSHYVYLYDYNRECQCHEGSNGDNGAYYYVYGL